MTAASKLRMATPAAAGGDPFFDKYVMFHEFWAENPAQSLSGEVTSWTNNGSNGTAATETSGVCPTYSAAGLGGKPCLDFDGVDNRLWISKGSTATLTQPGTYVLAMEWTTTATGDNLITSNDTSARYLLDNLNGNWRMYAGSSVSNGAISTSTVYIVVALFDGTSSVIRINGSETAMNTTGTLSHDGLVIGAVAGRTADYLDGLVGYAALFDGDLTAEAGFADYENALIAHYGA